MNPPHNPPQGRSYFAYGSNLWNEQMVKRCPESRKLGKATLTGYRWIITTRGYASIVKSPGDLVEGVVFEISPVDEAALDQFEGVASGNYFKVNLPVMMIDGDGVTSLVYIDPIMEEGCPKEEYIARINAGVIDAGLGEEYVERYIRKFVRI